jgi:spore photoproduct lyase
MKHQLDAVWVRQGLETLPEVHAFIAAQNGNPIHFFEKTTEVTVPGRTMAEKIENGKRTLAIDRRSGSLLDEFVNHDAGSICPNFPKLVPGTNCPYGCQYCFLALTYRACRPFRCAYVMDVAKLGKQLRLRHWRDGGVTVINAGEMSDPLAGDVLGYMPRIVEMFGEIDGVKLLLLTKSGLDEIQPILHADHNGHTITSWSITCDEVVERYEERTEPIASRLAAAKAAQDAGYEVRFRLDPFILFDGWQDAYARTINQVYALGVRPSRFTLGSFRVLGNLGGIIEARFPDSDLTDQPLVNDGGKRKRHPHKVRKDFYLTAIAAIRERDSDVPVALCKETPQMHRALSGLVHKAKCNCLP